jgi:hypothetical protein
MLIPAIDKNCFVPPVPKKASSGQKLAFAEGFFHLFDDFFVDLFGFNGMQVHRLLPRCFALLLHFFEPMATGCQWYKKKNCKSSCSLLKWG